MVRIAVIACEGCAVTGQWVEVESFFKLTGEAGSPPVKVTVGQCECGHRQILEGV